jgi:predicted AAA+ superfamily ATPase
MEILFSPHNYHLHDSHQFNDMDPDLRLLQSHSLIYDFPLLDQLPINQPGIYTLCGSHCTGKSTLLKNWIKKLLSIGIPPQAIIFFPGESIEDYHILKRLLQTQLLSMPRDITTYLILDNVAVIRNWAKAIKHIIDEAMLSNVTLMLSSSDLSITSDIQTTFNFHLYPLSFRETVLLKQGSNPNASVIYEEFNHYLVHGGYLNAIHDVTQYGCIQDKTLSCYSEWICKEVTTRGKQENYLREILNSVIKHHNSQVTWNLLAQELTIDHPKTIGDYFSLLESLDIVFVQYALLEDTLSAAPKKARKLMFADPFIYHVIQAWLSQNKNHFETQIKSTLENPEVCSKLVETCTITQFRRYYPTYYIKAEGEVDLAYIHNQRFWPVETTWISQIRSKDLKQILKYPNGRILTKTDRSGIIQHIKTEPLPLALWQLAHTKNS